MALISSSTLRVTTQPRVAPFRRVSAEEIVLGVTGSLEAVGTVTFAGSAAGSGAGWSVGFLQAQVTETNVGIYRGVNEAGGTVFEDRAPASMRVVPCFDAVKTGTPFTFTPEEPPFKPNGAPTELRFVAGPGVIRPGKEKPVSVVFSDSPSAPYLTVRNNTTTSQPNFINELLVAFGFVTVLAARDPAGKFHYLRGFTWSVNWHQKVVVSGGQLTSVPVAGGDRFVMSPIFEGRPTQQDAMRIFEGARTTTCNLLGDRMQNNPELRSVAGWPAYTPSR